MKYSLYSNGDQGNLTAVIDGELYTCDNTHPNFHEIVRRVTADDSTVVELFDVERTVVTKFAAVSERVSVAHGKVYFDGDLVDNSLSRAIVRALQEQADVTGLALFMENIAANPNEHSKNSLYTWLKDRDFTITDDGCLIAYKGVDKADDGTFISVSTGTAVVDGKVWHGQIPNAIGSVVTMARSDVQHDPSVGCHTGLHAGTWEYASTFGSGGTLTVKINPRDVVSVPTDCEWQKMRVCRYEVLDLVENPTPTLMYSSDPLIVDADYCEECGDDICCYEELCDNCYDLSYGDGG